MIMKEAFYNINNSTNGKSQEKAIDKGNIITSIGGRANNQIKLDGLNRNLQNKIKAKSLKILFLKLSMMQNFFLNIKKMILEKLKLKRVN